MELSDDLILLGKVSGTHGIRGELRIYCYSGDYGTLMGLRTLQLRGATGDVLNAEMDSARLHGGKAIVKLKRFDSINDVSHLVGRELVIHRDQLPETDEGEYYWHDLIGLTVVTDDGLELGTLSEIFDTGSNDVYVVRNGKREYLIPALVDVVREIDLTSRIMKVTPLEGLLDL
ncbi:16S rRNA processing protein RimM [Geobacter pelophilus]|uniref:Ribosome maturation factor RimM n=1 Tax=Geoanaerobacter pelophilus TaxID=60036 RepID=A0AAW4L4Q4_9BACT|nr:ribosome maturation factor RimM [Geoanaerobacter pelophilus]MBT0663216.1 16S rRNA processing protein RimM [Geoanaerobacter pelophilus]